MNFWNPRRLKGVSLLKPRLSGTNLSGIPVHPEGYTNWLAGEPVRVSGATFVLSYCYLKRLYIKVLRVSYRNVYRRLVYSEFRLSGNALVPSKSDKRDFGGLDLLWVQHCYRLMRSSKWGEFYESISIKKEGWSGKCKC